MLAARALVQDPRGQDEEAPLRRVQRIDRGLVLVVQQGEDVQINLPACSVHGASARDSPKLPMPPLRAWLKLRLALSSAACACTRSLGGISKAQLLVKFGRRHSAPRNCLAS